MRKENFTLLGTLRKKQCDYWQKADSYWKHKRESYFSFNWRRPIKNDMNIAFNGNVDLQTPFGMSIIPRSRDEITLEQIETIEAQFSPLI